MNGRNPIDNRSWINGLAPLGPWWADGGLGLASHQSPRPDRPPPTGVGSTACLVHDVKQPLSAILTNAEAALRWLSNDPPNLDEARRALERIVGNSHRAANVVRDISDGA